LDQPNAHTELILHTIDQLDALKLFSSGLFAVTFMSNAPNRIPVDVAIHRAALQEHL
jgi:hypothetical protein